MIRRRWKEEEIQSFLALLENHSLIEAMNFHATNTGRTYASVKNWYYKYKKNKNIPQSIIDNTPKRKNFWTNEETVDLLQLVAEHPSNFSEAFRLHAENTGRSVVAIKQYFSDYRRQETANTCMVTIGGKAVASPNRKNIYNGTGGTVSSVKQSKWKRILNILFRR